MPGEAQQESGIGQGHGQCARGKPKNVMENFKGQALKLGHDALAKGVNSLSITAGVGIV